MALHGPMVLGVCRQLLRDPNDVDDAFQATFLVLVRKVGTLRRCDLLGNWLYGVAHRVASRARALAARRMARAVSHLDVGEPLAADESRPGTGRNPNDASEPDPRPWLHEEVSRLPEKYRIPIVLCYFEGLTHEAAATRLGWPLGTVKGRLARARDLLRRRLVRRGVTLTAAALTSRLAVPDARAAVPPSLALRHAQGGASRRMHGRCLTRRDLGDLSPSCRSRQRSLASHDLDTTEGRGTSRAGDRRHHDRRGRRRRSVPSRIGKRRAGDPVRVHCRR